MLRLYVYYAGRSPSGKRDVTVWPVVELFESFQGGLMASAERKPIMEIWGRAWTKGARPPPRNSSTGSGDRLFSRYTHRDSPGGNV